MSSCNIYIYIYIIQVSCRRFRWWLATSCRSLELSGCFIPDSVSCNSRKIIVIFELPMMVAFLAIQCSTSYFCFLCILRQQPGCRLTETPPPPPFPLAFENIVVSEQSETSFSNLKWSPADTFWGSNVHKHLRQCWENTTESEVTGQSGRSK